MSYPPAGPPGGYPGGYPGYGPPPGPPYPGGAPQGGPTLGFENLSVSGAQSSYGGSYPGYPTGSGMPMPSGTTPYPGAPPGHGGMMPPANPYPVTGMPTPAAPVGPPGYGPYGGPSAPQPHLTFGGAAMATAAFPGHYRAQQGPPMPQPAASVAPVVPPSAPSPRPPGPTTSPDMSSYSYSHSSSSSSSSSSTQNQSTSTSTTSVKKRPVGRASVKDHVGFDAQKDAEVLRKAMKGLGCDSKAIMFLLCSRSNAQRQKISLAYKTMHGRDLIKDLKSELGGNFEDIVIAMMTLPAEYDATQLRKSIKGLGTDEATLIEILCTRTNSEIEAIKRAYVKLFPERNLEKDIAGDTSGHFKKFLVALCNANREETDQVDYSRAQQDAQALYKAGEARWGTDESKFNTILCRRSFPQLRATFDEYSKICKYSLEESIRREMSGDLRDGMVAIVKIARNAPSFFAEKLYKSMKGLGTDDDTLIRVVVTRSEVDLMDIKDEFHKLYSTSLGKFISDDTRGNYKKILLELIGDR